MSRFPQANVHPDAQIGNNVIIEPFATVQKDVIIDDDCWIGPNSAITPQLKIGDKGFVTIGSVVTRNVEPGQTVSGNFAIEHSKFIKFIKTIR